MKFSLNSHTQNHLIRYVREGNPSEVIGLDLFGLLSSHIENARSGVQPRSLDFYSIVHVIEGSAWVWTESNARIAVSTGDMVLFFPNTTFDFAAANGNARVDRLCFNGSAVNKLKQESLLHEGVCSIGSARRLLPAIRYAQDDTREGALRARSAFLHLLTELEVERLKSTTQPSRISALIDAIQQHPETWRDSQQMAAFCHLSEAQLRRIFKQETGLSPKTFQDTVRAKKAEELLQNGFSVTVVSDLLGFSDPFHFSRRFKAIIGKTPRDCLNEP